MKTIKKGFTLAEVLISMVVIGVIMAASIQTIKIVQASYTSLAFFEFDNIKAIAGEAIGGNSGSTPKDVNDNYISDVSVRKGSKVVITPDDETFCKYVTAISNVAKRKRTDGLPLCHADTMFDVQKLENHLSLKPHVNSTYEEDEDEEELEIIDRRKEFDSEPTFITNSGKRYYLSKRVKSAKEGSGSIKTISDNYGYRILAVDLNGTKGPNILDPYEDMNMNDEFDNKKVPDIIKFVIMDNGEVFPIGVAADNFSFRVSASNPNELKKLIYIMANVKGYYFTSKAGRSEDVIPTDCKRQLADKDGKPTGTRQCDFAVVNVKNPFRTDNPEAIIFSYRQAYCLALGSRSSEYEKYCDSAKLGSTVVNYCPPSSSDQAFDECRVRNIKPAFRYNL